MGLLSTRLPTTSSEPTDFFYKTNVNNTSDNKIQRQHIFGQDLTSSSDVTFNTITATNLGGGIYTPNIAASSGPISGTPVISSHTYFSFGNMCCVSGNISISATSSTGAINITLTLPIASNFASTDELQGSMTIENGSSEQIATTKHVSADPSNNGLRVQIFKSTSGTRTFLTHYSCLYEII